MALQLTVYHNRNIDFINTASHLEVWDSSCAFSEGPVWNTKGFYLFSDIPNNTIYKIDGEGKKETFLYETGCSLSDKSFLSDQVGSNGLAYNNAGDLFICQHGNGAVAKWNGDQIHPVVTQFMSKRFNSPNDLVIDKDGALFFSDPPYGLKDQQLSPSYAQPSAGIYCFRDNDLKLFCDQYHYPNGVCLSTGGGSLYTCSNKPTERYVLEWDVKTLQLIRTVAEENGDGIKCDGDGNIYLCAKEGIVVIDNKGQRIALLLLPSIPTNCCWGGPGKKDLFITARKDVYLIRNFLLG